MKDPIFLSDELFRGLTGQSGDTDKECIARIIEEEPDLENLIHEIDNPYYVDRELKKMNSFDVDSGWQRVNLLVGRSLDERESLEESVAGRRSHKLFKPWIIAVAAAVSAVVFTVAWMLFHGSSAARDNDLNRESITKAMADCEAHGLTGATIEKKDFIVRKRTCAPETGYGDSGQSHSDRLKGVKVTTYQDKEYWLKLPDGTIVHLDRDTRLVYPDEFDGEYRDVYLDGEAYFIVAKNDRSRFTVHTEAGTARVYGTEFNVSARSGSECRIVLVDGSVNVTTPQHESKMLQPGEMAEMVDGKMSVSEVDPDPYKAWNTGRVDFEEWPLGKVLAVMGKWYDKEVLFEKPEFAAVEISGSLNRYEDLTPAIEALSTITGLSISVGDGAIKVGH